MLFIAVVLLLYGVNYCLTPMIVGRGVLEVSCRTRPPKKPFESQAWKDSGLVESGGTGRWSASYGRRYEMVDDLVAEHLAVGMQGSSVTNMLGNPDAGIIDRRELGALGNVYGLFDTSPAKEILGSPDEIAYWSYHLAPQQRYPAYSVWFPLMFGNGGNWKLLIKLKNGKVFDRSITF